MTPLTPHQRELALHRIALAVGWDMLETYRKDAAQRTARIVLAELERGAVSGASEKRALEILMRTPTDEVTP